MEQWFYCNSEDLTGLSAGIYSVTVTDVATGCTETLSVTVNEPSSAFAVNLNAGGNGTACLGESVTLTMNGFASPNNTYQWSDANGVIVGATSSTYVATATGTYSLTVTTPMVVHILHLVFLLILFRLLHLRVYILLIYN